MTRITRTILALTLAVAPIATFGQDAAAEAVVESDDIASTQLEDGVFWTGEAPALSEFLWLKRPVVVFADTPNDPQFRRQMENLERRPDDLAYRDVVVLTDTDPAAEGPLRQALRPRGFALVIIGKDGQVEMRKPLPWSVREIAASIDKTPLRQQELRDLHGQ